MACRVCANRLGEKWRQTFSMLVNVFPEVVVSLVHGGEPTMHLMAAPIEPTIDGHSVSLGDVHHGSVRRGLAGPHRRVGLVVDCSLFSPQGLPVIRGVVPGPFLRLDDRFGAAPVPPHFVVVTREIFNPSNRSSTLAISLLAIAVKCGQRHTRWHGLSPRSAARGLSGAPVARAKRPSDRTEDHRATAGFLPGTDRAHG